VFSGTIGGNVRLGNPKSATSRFRQALAAVHADRFVNALPEGAATPVAERGATLSTGQKQFAVGSPGRWPSTEDPRARRGDVEHRHRNGTADPRCPSRADGGPYHDRDRSPVVDDPGHGHDPWSCNKGQLRESGSHQELLAQRGLYHRLYQLQYVTS